MTRKNPSVLFSTQTQLSLYINENYYGDLHFMYCSPWIGYPYGRRPNPPSSTPIERYNNLKKEVRRNDLSGPYILTHRSGLLTGIEKKYLNKLIDQNTRDEIQRLIINARAVNYTPVICQVDIEAKVANFLSIHEYPEDPLSIEYLLEDLPGKYIIKQRLEED